MQLQRWNWFKKRDPRYNRITTIWVNQKTINYFWLILEPSGSMELDQNDERRKFRGFYLGAQEMGKDSYTISKTNSVYISVYL